MQKLIFYYYQASSPFRMFALVCKTLSNRKSINSLVLVYHVDLKGFGVNSSTPLYTAVSAVYKTLINGGSKSKMCANDSLQCSNKDRGNVTPNNTI